MKNCTFDFSQTVLCWQSSLRLVVTQKNIASHFGSHINSLRENVPFNTLVTVLIDVVASLQQLHIMQQMQHWLSMQMINMLFFVFSQQFLQMYCLCKPKEQQFVPGSVYVGMIFKCFIFLWPKYQFFFSFPLICLFIFTWLLLVLDCGVDLWVQKYYP